MSDLDRIEKIREELRKNREDRVKNIIEWLEKMVPFTEDNIPEPPILDSELYEKYVIPNFIRCGAIPKDKLIVGETYIGRCRNSREATWNGKEFQYMRRKFGSKFLESVNHFQDDSGNGCDVFVPIKLKQ